MLEVKVGDMYGCLESIMAIGRQEMGLAEAEKIADFTDIFVKVLSPLDVRRKEMFEAEYESEGEKMAAFDAFAVEKAELPEFSFKEFGSLRITPDGLASLKRAGLYT